MVLGATAREPVYLQILVSDLGLADFDIVRPCRWLVPAIRRPVESSESDVGPVVVGLPGDVDRIRLGYAGRLQVPQDCRVFEELAPQGVFCPYREMGKCIER